MLKLLNFDTILSISCAQSRRFYYVRWASHPKDVERGDLHCTKSNNAMS